MKLNIYKSKNLNLIMFKKISLIFMFLFFISIGFSQTPINENESDEFFNMTNTLFNWLNMFVGMLMFFVLVFSGLKFSMSKSLEERQSAKRMLVMGVVGFILFLIIPVFLEAPFAINEAISQELFGG